MMRVDGLADPSAGMPISMICAIAFDGGDNAHLERARRPARIVH
jgi:hypothetical protein